MNNYLTCLSIAASNLYSSIWRFLLCFWLLLLLYGLYLIPVDRSFVHYYEMNSRSNSSSICKRYQMKQTHNNSNFFQVGMRIVTVKASIRLVRVQWRNKSLAKQCVVLFQYWTEISCERCFELFGWSDCDLINTLNESFIVPNSEIRIATVVIIVILLRSSQWHGWPTSGRKHHRWFSIATLHFIFYLL